MTIWYWVHVVCAVLSVSGFALRGYWMFTDSALRTHKLTRILPHVNDTILLVAAIVLMVMTAQYPLENAWLTAKLIGLVAYIGLGLVAFRFAKTSAMRIAGFVGALLVIAWMFAVALSRSPWIV